MNVYPKFKEHQLDSGSADNVDVNTDTLKLLFLNGHTYDAADVYVSDVLADAGTTEIGRSGALASITVTNGTVDAADNQTSGLPAGDHITDVVLFCDKGGADTANPVICHIDEDQSAVALDLLTDGSPVNVSFDAAGIFDL